EGHPWLELGGLGEGGAGNRLRAGPSTFLRTEGIVGQELDAEAIARPTAFERTLETTHHHARAVQIHLRVRARAVDHPAVASHRVAERHDLALADPIVHRLSLTPPARLTATGPSAAEVRHALSPRGSKSSLCAEGQSRAGAPARENNRRGF